MRLEVVLVALLLASPLLAGCLKKPEGEVDAAAVVNETAFVPPEGRGPIVAFEETNATEAGAGGVDHHHDLWNGQSRVVIFETQAMMSPGASPDGVSATFRPPQGTFIFEGTGLVEFTIANPTRHACEPLVTFGGKFYCTDYLGEGRPAAPPVPDPKPSDGLELRYKHASTAEWIDAGPLAWGTPLPIKITQPTETDMPHATSSVWEFQVTSPHSYDSTLAFTAKAEMVRGEGDVPLWPGHPDFYAERDSRTVVESVPAKACDGGLTGAGCLLAGDGVEPVVPSKLISYGTRTLYIWANITDAQFPNPATQPTVWFLYHRNATGQNNITDIFDQNHAIDVREHSWILPVDDGSMDSPYADGSRWEFELGAAFTPPAGSSCYGGCADWYAEYTLTVIASSVALPGEEYDMYCLSPDSYCGEE